ncbi:MAG: hypothetical protein ACOC1K_02560 [Nanoarchaeota archaeon]
MIKWTISKIDFWTHKIDLSDDSGNIYNNFFVSPSIMPIVNEILLDYKFAIEINSSSHKINYNKLSQEDGMDLFIITISKLESID